MKCFLNEVIHPLLNFQTETETRTRKKVFDNVKIIFHFVEILQNPFFRPIKYGFDNWRETRKIIKNWLKKKWKKAKSRKNCADLQNVHFKIEESIIKDSKRYSPISRHLIHWHQSQGENRNCQLRAKRSKMHLAELSKLGKYFLRKNFVKAGIKAFQSTRPADI